MADLQQNVNSGSKTFTGIIGSMTDKRSKGGKPFKTIIFYNHEGQSLLINSFNESDNKWFTDFARNKVFTLEYTINDAGFTNLSTFKIDEDIPFEAFSSVNLTKAQAENLLEIIEKDLLADGCPDSLCKLYLNFKASPYYEAFKLCPAASSNHHQLQGGLVLHSFEVFSICKSVLEHSFVGQEIFQKSILGENIYHLNKWVTLYGAFFHDIGKLFCYNRAQVGFGFNFNRNNVDAYHLSLGVEFISSLMSGEYSSFHQQLNDEYLAAVKHCIRGHHALLEWQSIVKPSTPEAVLVFCADYFSGFMGGYMNADFSQSNIAKAYNSMLLHYELE